MSDYEYGMAQNWIEQFRERPRVRNTDLAHSYVDCFNWADTPQNHNVWVRRMLERHPEYSDRYTCFVNGEPQI